MSEIWERSGMSVPYLVLLLVVGAVFGHWFAGVVLRRRFRRRSPAEVKEIECRRYVRGVFDGSTGRRLRVEHSHDGRIWEPIPYEMIFIPPEYKESLK